MPNNPYYSEEMDFLRNLAREHPATAPLARAKADPDVDRVLEGVAYLTAGIRARLDDDLPELTQTLLEMLWPHYLRPQPSLCIAEFTHPTRPKIAATQMLARGETELDSVPVDGTACRFRTCYDVAFHPLALESAALELTGRGALRVRFKLLGNARPEEVPLDPLRLYLHGDTPTASLRYLWLLRHVRAVVIEVPGANGVARHALPEHPAPVQPVGFAPEQGLFPYPRHSFMGYRLLQEYFALPEKFLFVDVRGIDLRALGVATHFDVVFHFAKQPPAALRFDAEHLRLHCTPAVNLRAMQGDPIKIAPERRAYLLRPQHRDPGHFEVYSVDRVIGLLHGRDERREYHSFYSFQHGLRAGDATYYQVSRRASAAHANSDCWMHFASATEKAALPEAETISFDLTCTNRTLCHGLDPGDVRVHTDASPQFAEFANLTKPTRSVLPPLGGPAHWGLISHLALNFSSLASIDGLRAALRVYCFPALDQPDVGRALDQRLHALQRMECAREERLFRGAPIRGVHSTLHIDETGFANDGELYVFAALLEEFLALYVSLNSFSALTVRGARHGEVYRWSPRLGRQIIL